MVSPTVFSLGLVVLLCSHTARHELWDLESEAIFFCIVTGVFTLIVHEVLEHFALVVENKLNESILLQLHELD